METVVEYIASFDGETRKRLEILDAFIKKINGNITGKISWAMPSYMLNGNCIVQFCAFKNHIGLYPGPIAINAFKNVFEKENLKYTKGGVQLPNDRALPLELVKLIVLNNCENRLQKQIRSDAVLRSEKQLPDELRTRLINEGQLENYDARPRYQRTDYISWIEKAKMPQTREKRILQMVDELRNGDAYMGMAYNAKKAEDKKVD